MHLRSVLLQDIYQYSLFLLIFKIANKIGVKIARFVYALYFWEFEHILVLHKLIYLFSYRWEFFLPPFRFSQSVV